MGVPLELLHVLGRREISTLPTDFSGSLGAGAQEMLLTELAALDEQKAKLAEARGRLILDEAKTRIAATPIDGARSEEHTSELQSLMRSSYAVICLKKIISFFFFIFFLFSLFLL